MDVSLTNHFAEKTIQWQEVSPTSHSADRIFC